MKISLKHEYGEMFIDTKGYSENDEQICEVIYRPNFDEDGVWTGIEKMQLNVGKIQFDTAREFLCVLRLGIDMYKTYFSDTANSFHAIYAKDISIQYSDYNIELLNLGGGGFNSILVHDTINNIKAIIPVYTAEFISLAIANELSAKSSSIIPSNIDIDSIVNSYTRLRKLREK